MIYLIQQILTCTATMSVLTLAFFGMRKLLEQKQSARWRYAVWWILGIGFLTPFKPRFGRGLMEISVPHEFYNVYTPQGYMTVIDHSLPRGWKILLIIWLIGAAVTAIRMLSRQYHFARSVRRLGTPAGEVAQTVYQLVCMEMEIPADAQVLVVPMISTPMMTGLFNPCILLPKADYTSEELRLIFKHELTHNLRGDLWCKLLWMCCMALHWFNPLMPKFVRQMEQDCEMACDETVLQGESEETAAAYCNTILDTAMRRCRARTQNTLLATNFSGSKENLRSRIHAILFRRKKRRFPAVAFAAAMLTLLTGSLVVYTASYKEAQPLAMEEPMIRDVMDYAVTETTQDFEFIYEEPDVIESTIIYSETDQPVWEELPEVTEPVQMPQDEISYGFTVPMTVQEQMLP